MASSSPSSTPRVDGEDGASQDASTTYSTPDIFAQNLENLVAKQEQQGGSTVENARLLEMLVASLATRLADPADPRLASLRDRVRSLSEKAHERAKILEERKALEELRQAQAQSSAAQREREARRAVAAPPPAAPASTPDYAGPALHTVHELTRGASELQGILSACCSAYVTVILKWTAPWCGPCRAIHPLLVDTARSLGESQRFLIVSVDCEIQANKSLMQEKSISGFPTFDFLPNAREGQRERVVGANPESFRQALWRALAKAQSDRPVSSEESNSVRPPASSSPEQPRPTLFFYARREKLPFEWRDSLTLRDLRTLVKKHVGEDQEDGSIHFILNGKPLQGSNQSYLCNLGVKPTSTVYVSLSAAASSDEEELYPVNAVGPHLNAGRATRLEVRPPHTLGELRASVERVTGTWDQRMIFLGRILVVEKDAETLESLGVSRGSTVMLVPGGGVAPAHPRRSAVSSSDKKSAPSSPILVKRNRTPQENPFLVSEKLRRDPVLRLLSWTPKGEDDTEVEDGVFAESLKKIRGALGNSV